MTIQDVLFALTYVAEVQVEDTGGGHICDVLTLTDGTVLFSSESVVLYESMEVWQDDQFRQMGVINRV